MIVRSLFALAVALPLAHALPVAAQTIEKVEGRVKKLEGEMRAVQRKVFPGANKEYFEPEIAAPATSEVAPGVQATNPVQELTARVDSLERQVVALTGQIELDSHKLRQLEAAFAKYKTDSEFRISTLEGGGQPLVPPDKPAAVAAPASKPTAPSISTAAGKTSAPADGAPATEEQLDPIEAEYRAGYALVESKQFTKAEVALTAFIGKHPKHPRASNAQYWLGRTYFAQGQPGQAARTLLENYQKRPEGMRAPESLLWLGKSLMALPTPSPSKACEAYAQLEAEYSDKLSASLRAQLSEARIAATCK